MEDQGLRRIISQAKRLVFFGGAGVSTASGIPDFRSPAGLNARADGGLTAETALSRSFLYLQPEAFFAYYRRHLLYPDAKPNAAHMKLFELEQAGRLRGVVTQNIDGLHQIAGSKRVWELHGTVHRNICRRCGAVYSAEWVLATTGVPHCEKCGGQVKPDVVLYEEGLDEQVITGAMYALARADLLIIGGTSLVVYPAAGLVRYFQGDELVICNLEPTKQDSSADLVLACDIAKAFDF